MQYKTISTPVYHGLIIEYCKTCRGEEIPCFYICICTFNSLFSPSNMSLREAPGYVY